MAKRKPPSDKPSSGKQREAKRASPAAAPELDPKDPSAEALRLANGCLAYGDLRSARRLARSVLAGQASEAARDEARRIVADTGPDPAALWAAVLVALTIAIAVWAALFHKAQ